MRTRFCSIAGDEECLKYMGVSSILMQVEGFTMLGMPGVTCQVAGSGGFSFRAFGTTFLEKSFQ